MYNWNLDWGPAEDHDAWEDNVAEQYEIYCEMTKEKGFLYTMSFEAYRNKMIEEMEEHIAGIELEEVYN